MIGYLLITFAFIGTLIGAGFASGREIAEFFGNANLFSIVISGLATGALAYPFLRIGSIANGDPIGCVCGKFGIWGEYSVRILNLIILSTVLAAAEYIIYISLGVSGGAIITGIAALLVAGGTLDKIKIINAILVPVILTLLVVMLSRKGIRKIDGSFKIISPILYSAMNALSAGLIAAKASSDLDKKGALIVSALIAIVTTALLLVVRFVIVGNEECEMPVYQTAATEGLGMVGALIIYAAIFSTAIGTLRLSAGENSLFSLVTALSIAFVISVAGFKTLVEYAYPVIGILGGIFIILAVIRLADKKIIHKLEIARLI